MPFSSTVSDATRVGCCSLVCPVGREVPYAKATAKEWGMNIIAVRAPDLKGSLVGESEEKTL